MNQENQLARRVENEHAVVGLRQDGIIHVYFKPHTELNVELQEIMLKIYNEITGGKQSLFIFEAGPYVVVTKEAREHTVDLEPRSPIKATVVYVNTLAYKLVAEFYYKFNKPLRPYKVTSDFQSGIDWLLQTEKEIDACSLSKP